MRSILGAWLAAMVLTSWREIMRTKDSKGKTIHPPPRPMDLAKASALFPVLILLHDFIPSNGKFTLPVVAWGFDLAVLLQILQGQKYSTGGPWPPLTLDDSILIPHQGSTPVQDTTSGAGAASAPSGSASPTVPNPATASPPKTNNPGGNPSAPASGNTAYFL